MRFFDECWQANDSQRRSVLLTIRSVVGCDGITIAAHSNPPLTTIDQPKYRMGQLAMQTLWRMLNEHYTPYGGYALMESPLVIRESTGPCP
jgi:DNA-binding LacI/PurR family transcriptional regulator